MRFEKSVLHENLTFVALVDDDERVIAAGVFNQQEDAETAIGFCQAMIFNADQRNEGFGHTADTA